jgi:hypothetical protein
VTYQQLLDQLKQAAPYDWPRIHGLIIAHRMACIRVVRDKLDELLREPGLSRRQLRQEMEVLLKDLEEHGA